MAELITKSELARRLGVTRSAVNGYAKKGQLAEKKRKGKTLVDYEATMKLMEAAKDPARAEFAKTGEVKSKGPITFADARTAKEAARARLAQISVKEKERELVNAQDLLFSLEDLFLNVRTSARAIPAKVTGEIMNIIASNPSDMATQIQEVLRREIDETLTDLSKWKLPS